jgi:hypothetical protein
VDGCCLDSVPQDRKPQLIVNIYSFLPEQVFLGGLECVLQQGNKDVCEDNVLLSRWLSRKWKQYCPTEFTSLPTPFYLQMQIGLTSAVFLSSYSTNSFPWIGRKGKGLVSSP